jgi:hypothetical protein
VNYTSVLALGITSGIYEGRGFGALSPGACRPKLTKFTRRTSSKTRHLAP